jgi:hypothetical protein
MLFQIAMANPGVHAVVWDRLRDDAGVGLRDGGLFAAGGAPKPAAERLLLTRRKLRNALGPMPEPGAAASVPQATSGSAPEVA